MTRDSNWLVSHERVWSLFPSAPRAAAEARKISEKLRPSSHVEEPTRVQIQYTLSIKNESRRKSRHIEAVELPTESERGTAYDKRLDAL